MRTLRGSAIGWAIYLHFRSFLLLFPGVAGDFDRRRDDGLKQLFASGRAAGKAPHHFAKPHPLDLLDDLAQCVEIRRHRRTTRLPRSTNVSRNVVK